MSNQPLVSVICLSMNHEAFIERSFHSVVQQTYPNLEIFYVDNHSSDGSFEKGYEILVQSGRVFKAVKRTRSYGTSENFNFFLGQVKGKYVSILSADDWWEGDNLSRKIAYFEQHAQYGMLHGAGFLYYHDTGKIAVEKVDSTRSGWVFKDVVKRNFINTIGVIIKKEVLDDVGFFDEESALEDWDMWIRIAEKYQVGFFEVPLVYYGRHGSNVSKNKVFMDAGYQYIFSKYRHLPEIKAARDYYEMVEIYRLAATKSPLKAVYLLLTKFRFSTVHFKQLIKGMLGIKAINQAEENRSNER